MKHELDLEQMRAAWMARFGMGWVDALDVFEDDYFFSIMADLRRLDSLDVNRPAEQYRIKVPQ
jgi:hypothetical protein